MKLPDKIKGIHKIRDFKICRFWIEDVLTSKKIAKIVKLTERRVQQILATNSNYIKINKEWEKKKRIHALKLSIKNSKSSKKDRADLIDQLRKEIEGDRPLVNLETHYHITKEEAIDRTNRLRELYANKPI